MKSVEEIVVSIKREMGRNGYLDVKLLSTSIMLVLRERWGGMGT